MIDKTSQHSGHLAFQPPVLRRATPCAPWCSTSADHFSVVAEFPILLLVQGFQSSSHAPHARLRTFLVLIRRCGVEPGNLSNRPGAARSPAGPVASRPNHVRMPHQTPALMSMGDLGITSGRHVRGARPQIDGVAVQRGSGEALAVTTALSTPSRPPPLPGAFSPGHVIRRASPAGPLPPGGLLRWSASTASPPPSGDQQFR